MKYSSGFRALLCIVFWMKVRLTVFDQMLGLLSNMSYSKKNTLPRITQNAQIKTVVFLKPLRLLRYSRQKNFLSIIIKELNISNNAYGDFLAIVIQLFCLNSVFDIYFCQFLMKQVDALMNRSQAFFHWQF